MEIGTEVALFFAGNTSMGFMLQCMSFHTKRNKGNSRKMTILSVWPCLRANCKDEKGVVHSVTKWAQEYSVLSAVLYSVSIY